MAPTAITIRAPRQLAFLCRPSRAPGLPGVVALTVRDSPATACAISTPDRLPVGAFARTSDSGDAWTLGSIAPCRPTAVRMDSRAEGSAVGGPWTRRHCLGRPGPRVRDAHLPTVPLERRRALVCRTAGRDRSPAGARSGDSRRSRASPTSTPSGAVTDQPNRVSLIEVRVRAPTMEPVRSGRGDVEAARSTASSSRWRSGTTAGNRGIDIRAETARVRAGLGALGAGHRSHAPHAGPARRRPGAASPGAERRLQHGFADAEAGLAAALDDWSPGLTPPAPPRKFRLPGNRWEVGGRPSLARCRCAVSARHSSSWRWSSTPFPKTGPDRCARRSDSAGWSRRVSRRWP